jgi:hypothetical protein
VGRSLKATSIEAVILSAMPAEMEIIQHAHKTSLGATALFEADTL